MFVDAIGAGMRGLLPYRPRQPGHAAGHRLHARVDGAGRGAVTSSPGCARPWWRCATSAWLSESLESRTPRRRPPPYRCPDRPGAAASGPSTTPARSQRRGHPRRPGPAGPPGRRSGQGRRRLRGPCRSRSSPRNLHKTHRRCRAGRPARRGGRPRGLPAATAAAPDGARIDGVLVSPMRRGGTELLVGVVRDRSGARFVVASIGGLFVEVLQDSRSRRCRPRPAGPPPAYRLARPARSTESAAPRPPTRPPSPPRRPDRRPRPGAGRRPRVARGQPAAGRRCPDRGARRRRHLEGALLMRTALTDLVGVPHPIVGFNRSPGVVAAVTNAGGFGVLGASAYTPAELDAQLTWIDEQTAGKPYGVDLLVPEKFATGDPGNLVASLRAQIPDGHLTFVRACSTATESPMPRTRARRDRRQPQPRRRGPLLDVAFRHPIRLIANASARRRPASSTGPGSRASPVAALVGQPRRAVRQIEAGVDVLIAQGTEAGGHTGTIATMVSPRRSSTSPAGARLLAAGGIAFGRRWPPPWPSARPASACGSVWLCSEEDVANQAVKAKFLRPPARTRCARRPDRQARPPAAQRLARGVGRPAARAPLPMPLQQCWSTRRGSGSTRRPGGPRGRVPARVVLRRPGRRLLRAGSPARQITRQIVADCERRIRDLAKLEQRGPRVQPPRARKDHPYLDPRRARRRRRRAGLRAPRRARLPAALAGRSGRRRGPDALADTGGEPAAVAAAIEVAVGSASSRIPSAGAGTPGPFG